MSTLAALDGQKVPDSGGLDVLVVSSDARPLRGGVARCIDGWLTGLSELGYRVGIISLLPVNHVGAPRGPKRDYEEWAVSNPDRGASAADALLPLRKLRTAAFLARNYLRERSRIAGLIRTIRPARIVLGTVDRHSQHVLREASVVNASTAAICYGSELRPGAQRLAPHRLRVLRAAGRVLAISRFTRELVAELLGCEPLDIALVRPSVASETERLARQDSPGSSAPPALRLAVVARLVERKGIQHVILSISMLRKQGIRAELAIIGEGAFEGALRREVERLGLSDQVAFLGGLNDEETVAVLGKATAFVLTPFEPSPGDVEGFGLAYLEAGALRLPVVATRSGGVPEAVLENETGLLVDPAAPQQIATAIARLARDESERRRFGEAGCAWALAHGPAQAARTLIPALGLP